MSGIRPNATSPGANRNIRFTSVPAKLIVLTDPAKRLIDEAIGRHVANEERLLLSLSEAEQESLSALLKKLIAGL